MDIPDELIESIRGCAEGYPRIAEDELRVVVSGFARQAQVAILEELRDYMADYGDELQGQQQPLDWADEKIRELEAGGGQTGGSDDRA